MNKNTIFITGGAGFLGSALSKYFSNKGDFVVVYDNFKLDQQKSFGQCNLNNLKVIKGDILDKSKLNSAMTENHPDTLIHLAAIHYIPYCEANPDMTLQINTVGTQNVLSSLNSYSKNTKLIFASSAAVYKDSNQSMLEDGALEPKEIYGHSKLFAEHLIPLSKIENYNILRIFNIYGKNDTNPHVIPIILEQLKRGTQVQLGNKDTCRDFIYIDDIVSAIDCVITQGKNKEVYNIGTGKCYSIENITKLVNQIKGGGIHFEFKDKQKRTNDRQILVANIEKIKRDTNWTPQVTIEKGIKTSIERTFDNRTPLVILDSDRGSRVCSDTGFLLSRE